MRKFSELGIKLGGLFAALALVLGVASTNAACFSFFHQPKVPLGMEKFVKEG